MKKRFFARFLITSLRISIIKRKRFEKIEIRAALTRKREGI